MSGRKNILLFYAFLCFNAAYTQVTNLRVEHLKSPLGIDMQNPRFGWVIKSNEFGVSQESYNIKFSSDPDLSESWETGEIQSEKQLHIYQGPPFKSVESYYWQVEVIDNYGSNYFSEIDSFSTGYMNDEWIGDWISDGKDIEDRSTPIFRKIFMVENEPDKVLLLIATGGLHEIFMNGERVSNEVLNPVFTKYDTRKLYNVYDVTQHILPGKNAISVMLGNGWFNHQPSTSWEFNKSPWRDRPNFKLNLVLNKKDSSQIVKTDSTWKFSETHITFNSIYLAENMSSINETKDWIQVDFDHKSWKEAKTIHSTGEIMQAQLLPPIRKVDTLKPISVRKFSDYNYIFDFGKNISGNVKFSGKVNTLTNVRLTYGEQLNKDGRVHIGNLTSHYRNGRHGEDFQQDNLEIWRGDFEIQNQFSYKGFRYVGIFCNSAPINLGPDNMVAYEIHSDLEPIGYFQSSDATLNKIWEITNNSYLSNMMGYPTDCPQREKNGWTGDAHLIAETGLLNFDGIAIYEKWMEDHRDAQTDQGFFPSIIPTGGWGYDRPNDWISSSIIQIPWAVYLYRGDVQILRDNYESMKKFLDEWNKSYTLFEEGIGDWKYPTKSSSIYFINQVTNLKCLEIMTKVSMVLGDGNLSQHYQDLSSEVRNKLNKQFFKRKSGTYAGGTQTELSLALTNNLPPKNWTEQIAQVLSETVRSNQNFLDVGIVGAKSLLYALSENGFIDQAIDIATKTESPSWGYWIKNGATSLWESWFSEGDVYGASQNHTYFGSISGWFFNELAGIQPDEQFPGFKKINFRPKVSKKLDFAEASHKGPYGLISSKWEWLDDVLVCRIRVPPNSNAVYTLPNTFKLLSMDKVGMGGVLVQPKYARGGREIHFVSGEYEFTLTNEAEVPQVDLETLPIYNEGIHGSLIIERDLVTFSPGNIQARTGNLTVIDLSGRKILQREVQYENTWILLKIRELGVSDGLYVIRLDNQYVDGSEKRFITKIKFN